MHEHEDGRVSGSIDRARVAELYGQTNDEELKAYYRDLLGESDEGKALDQPGEAEPDEAEADGVTEAAEVTEPAPPSMAMSKDELVQLAQGKVDDPESKTKAELVEALGGKA